MLVKSVKINDKRLYIMAVNNGAEVCILQTSAPAISYLMIVTVPSLRGAGGGVSPAL
jgi:hypothetical protein